MNGSTVYTHYHDPGHGWLAVPLADCRAVGFNLSHFCYVVGSMAYLEEDCEAERFIQAYTALWGHEPNMTSQYVECRSQLGIPT